MILTETQFTEVDILNEGFVDDVWSFVSKLFSMSPRDAERTARESRQRMASSELALRNKGVDVARVKKLAAEGGRKAAEAIRGTPMTEAALQEGVGSALSGTAEKVQEHFFKTYATIYNDLVKGDNVGEEWTVGTTLFLAALTINTFLHSMLLSFGVAPGLAMVILAVIIAPIVEESARRIALRSGRGLSAYTAILNTFEFANYVSSAVRAGAKFGRMVVIRIATAFGMHQVNSALQKWGYMKDLEGGKSEEEAGRIEFLAAIGIHVAWNTIGTVFSQAIGRWALGVKEDAAVDGLTDQLLHEDAIEQAVAVLLAEAEADGRSFTPDELGSLVAERARLTLAERTLI